MKRLICFLFALFAALVSFAQTQNLEYYLGQAKNKSPLLRAIQTQLSVGQLDSLSLRAGLKTQVNASSGGYYAPIVNGYGYAAGITNVHTLNALVGVSKQITGNGYLNAQLQALGLQRDSLNNISRLSEQDLRKTIISQYITAYGSLQQVRFNQDVVKLLSGEEDLLKKLTRSNVYKQSEYLAFLVTLKQQQLQLLQAKLQYKNDYATLNYLAGIADTSAAELAEPMMAKTVKPELSHSIFFRQYQLDSLRLNNSRKLLNYSYKPKTNIFADAGYNSDFLEQSYKNIGASVGFNITVPLYDGGLKKLKYKRLKLEEASRINSREFFKTQYRQQVNQLEQQISENEKLIDQINEQMKYSESLVKVDTQLLQTGDVRIADLILAVNNYYTIKNLLTQTTVSRLQLINQLNYWNK